MEKYIMAIDAGTSSSRCILFNKNGEICSMAQREFTQIYPKPGWVEHNAEEIWETQLYVCRAAMEKIGASSENIVALGIANQRETTVIWDKHTGKPVYNAIVWQCRRTAELCDTLKEKGFDKIIRKKTGLIIDAYFSATKIHWILENVPGAREKAEQGDLLFGTVDSWLMWNLSGGRVHKTDYSNASRTMLYNIKELQWDEDILKELSIPETMLPEVWPSSGLFGYTDAAWFNGSIPMMGVAGDQQAAMFAQGCFTPGDAKNTYGTGCFILMNIGTEIKYSENGLVTTIAWGVDGDVEYALEGSVFVAGAAVQWLRDELKLISTSAESEQWAFRVPDTNGCYVVPAFTGLGAPYWDQYARGCIVGLTRGVNRSHLIRATLESIAYQSTDLLLAMEKDSGLKLTSLKVDGGACANNFLMQFQSDIIKSYIFRPACIETTALGAAYLAGLAAGYWNSKKEILKNRVAERVFEPDMPEEVRVKKLDEWHKAVKHSFEWSK